MGVSCWRRGRQRSMSVEVRVQIVSCDRCELSGGCESPVPWSGPAPNPFCVLGEAPGVEEDREGKPFVGVSGRLLRLWIDIAFGEKGYADALSYLNAVCCFPHGTPRASHIRACHDHLEAQLRVLEPRYGLCCGGIALNALWPGAGNVGDLRGQWLQVDRGWGRCFWLVVLHPAAILRDPRRLSGQRGQQWIEDLGQYAEVVTRFRDPPGALAAQVEKGGGEQLVLS